MIGVTLELKVSCYYKQNDRRPGVHDTPDPLIVREVTQTFLIENIEPHRCSGF